MQYTRGIKHLNNAIRQSHKHYSSVTDVNGKSLPRLVIAGSGWSAIHFARRVDRTKFDTCIISPKNFFTFTPLLPFLCSGKIFPEACTESLHHLFKGIRPKIIFSEAHDVDFKDKVLICKNLNTLNDNVEVMKIPYDYLVIAIGAMTNTFNIPNVEKNAYFLKDLSDATSIYNRICSNCEFASYPNLPLEKIQDLCRIIIVGGGPSGVETAACINESIVRSLSRQFPHLKDYLKVHLVESGKGLLATFSPKISRYTLESFEKDGITVRLNTRVDRVEADYCEFVDNETGKRSRVGHGIVIWVSGLACRPLTKKLADRLAKSENNTRNALSVDQYLRVRGVDDVFAMGDCAMMVPDRLSDKVEDIANLLGNRLSTRRLNRFRGVLIRRYPQMSKLKWKDSVDGKALSLQEFKDVLNGIDNGFRAPFPTAQNARQQGIYLANLFNNFISSNQLNIYELQGSNNMYVRPFCEVWRGSIAYIGMNKTVFNLPFIQLMGKLLLKSMWKYITMDMLLSCRSRSALLISWILDKIFGKARTNLQYNKAPLK